MTKHKVRRVALYLRVSTSEQTTKNQRRELEAVAERHGWLVVSAFEDAGISGAKGREFEEKTACRPQQKQRRLLVGRPLSMSILDSNALASMR